MRLSKKSLANLSGTRDPDRSKPIRKLHKFEINRFDIIPSGADFALLIDGTNLFLRNASVPNMAILTNSAGQKTGGLYGTLKSLAAEIRHWQPKYVYFVLDKNGSRRKSAIHSDYKANRPHSNGVRVGSGEEGSVEDIEARLEYEARQRQLKILEEVLPNLGICCCMVPGIEADDIIGNLVTLHEYNVVISTDTDFIQLHNGVNIFVYNPITKRLRSVEEFGVIGPSYAVLKSVIGDPTDNIRGLDRVGWKTLIKWCDNHYPSTLAELRSMVEARSESNPLASKILENWSTVERNYKLIALDPHTTEMNPQLVLLMRSWRNRPVNVNIMRAASILQSEGIEVQCFMDLMGVLQNLNH